MWIRRAEWSPVSLLIQRTPMSMAYIYSIVCGAGRYIVEITPDNFAPGGPLEGFLSSTGNPGDLSSGPYENREHRRQ
ncbi:MAG: hypothetical protein IPO69_04485 [Saprospiraceae bacterium]|nr:hypothetical protein [Saprospiraceae bacterium]